MELRPEARTYNNSSELERTLADHVTGLSESAIREHGSFSMFLSGGSVIGDSLRKLSEEPYSGKINWSKWHVFTADDRHGHLEIPYTYGGLLSKVPSAQVYNAFDNKLSSQPLTVDYQFVLRELAKTNEFPLVQNGTYPNFDLVLVGNGPGPNGNINPLSFSVFRYPLVRKTSSEAVWSSSLELPTVSFGDSLLETITFTLPVINSGANVIFLGTGQRKPVEMMTFFFGNSTFGDIPTDLVDPYVGNLVWFRQAGRQKEAEVNSTRAATRTLAISAIDKRMINVGANVSRDGTFYWQEDTGRIYRPMLSEVEKRLELLLLNSDLRKVLLNHARYGLESEVQFNWKKARQHYLLFLAWLGSPDEHWQDDEHRMWLRTWLLVPLVLWSQFVGSGLKNLVTCRKNWEYLKKMWPFGSDAFVALRNHEALCLVDISQRVDDTILGNNLQALAVGWFSDLFLSEGAPLIDKFSRMCIHLHSHYRGAWNVAKANHWLQKAFDHLKKNGGANDRYRVILSQYGLLVETGNRLEASDVLNTLTRKLRLENSKARALKRSTLDKDMASFLELIEFIRHHDRGHRLPDNVVKRALEGKDWYDRVSILQRVSRFGDALKVLEHEMSLEGNSSTQQRNILLCMASCHKNLSSEVRPIDWSVGGDSIVHLDNVVLCYEKALAVSSQPGWSAVDRLSDRIVLGTELAFRVVVPLARQVEAKPLEADLQALAEYFEAWNYAWAVLQNCSELSSRLLHANWDPLYVDFSQDMRVSERMCELLGSKIHLASRLFLKRILPEDVHKRMHESMAATKGTITFSTGLVDRFHEFSVKHFGIDCSPSRVAFRKLICSERGRARTLLFEERSLLTEMARDHLLLFTTDEEVATSSLRNSISACGPDSVFVSFEYLRSSPETISITLYEQLCEGAPNCILRMLDLVQEIEVDSDKTTQALKTLQETLDLLSSPSWKEAAKVEKNSKQLDDHLERLFDILLSPLAKWFESKKPEQKLIFCTSKNLASIPFPILRNRERRRYLFQDHTISVTPSLRILHPCSQRYEFLQAQKVVERDAAGVVLADPEYEDEGRTLVRPEWPRLLKSSDEADAIGSLFPHRVKKLKRAEATVQNLLEMARLPSTTSSFQSFIHIAAHAVVNVEHPRGVLVLSKGSTASDNSAEIRSTVAIDGLQNTQGVADLPSQFGEVAAGVHRNSRNRSRVAGNNAMISADQIVSCNFKWCTPLVVLSACNSVNGQTTFEGIHNLPRAFMIAGVPCVVASQWRVSDEVAPKLMKVFYTCLRNGKDVASALRCAMCQLLEEGHCLYNFAPFLVWGLPTIRLPQEFRSDEEGPSPPCTFPTPQREFARTNQMVYRHGFSLSNPPVTADNQGIVRNRKPQLYMFLGRGSNDALIHTFDSDSVNSITLDE